ncbi:MAG: HAD-IA family hydrolase [Anaerolineae bacterium]|nr:HAD-IA family hydrolase [Anaerolineae bacterium]
MPIAFIFDFGGVLMKTQDYSPRHSWDERLGLPHGSIEKAVHNADSWVRAQKGEITPADYWADVASQLGISSDDVTQLAHDFYAGDVLDSNLIALIQKLRDEGHVVGLLSNDSLELEAKLHRLGIDSLFDPLHISAKLGVMKPHLDIYARVRESLPHDAYPIVLIDDRIDNIHGAIKAGWVGVFYQPKLDIQPILYKLIDAHRKKIG